MTPAYDFPSIATLLASTLRVPTMNQLRTLPIDRHNDTTLLEGLFQLVVSGDTCSSEFRQLDATVYERLQSTYAADEVAIGSAPVSRAMMI